jgi:hypothetical protein
MLKPEVKAEAIRLRVEDRLSIKAIVKKLGISQGTCSTLLREYPLSAEECRDRNKKSGGAMVHAAWNGITKSWGTPSKHFKDVTNNNQKGRIAESAVAFRLALLGIDYFKPEGGSSKADLIADTGSGLVRIQVKWANVGTNRGLPSAKLACANGRKAVRRYRSGEFDVLVVYSLYTDTAYVFDVNEVIHKTSVTIREDCAEAWHKIHRAVAQPGLEQTPHKGEVIGSNPVSATTSMSESLSTGRALVAAATGSNSASLSE